MTQENDLKSEFKRILLETSDLSTIPQKGFIFNPDYQYGLNAGYRPDSSDKMTELLMELARNCSHVIPYEYRGRVELVIGKNSFSWFYSGKAKVPA